jgi:hypothetical protein
MAVIFSREFDITLRRVLAAAILASAMVAAAVWYYFTPKYTRVGYAPEQPVAFSHEQHVGKLGMSCLYCHTNVERSPHASVPSTQTCMSCHTQIKADSPLLSPARESWASGDPLEWKRIHKVPDYAYFNHALHINRGVGCVSCHGQVNEMKVVYHAKPLSMGWCLECHRKPEAYLRPAAEAVNMSWTPPADQTQIEVGRQLVEQLHIRPGQNCQGCHR